MIEEGDKRAKRSRSPDYNRKSSNEKTSIMRRRRTGWDTQEENIALSDPIYSINLSTTSASFGSESSAPVQTQFMTSSSVTSTIPVFDNMLNDLQSTLSSHSTALAYQKRALCRIYVGSLDYFLTMEEIKRVFEAFGTIVTIDMPREGDRSKGFCFVEFVSPESADMALSSMQGFLLKGRNIKVGRPSSSGLPLPPPLPTLSPVNNQSIISPTVPTPSPLLDPTNNSISPSEAGALAAATMITNKANVDINTILKKTSGFSPDSDANNINDLHKQSSNPQQLVSSTFIPNLDPTMPSASRIYVGNVPADLTSADLEKIFTVFGKVLSCYLLPNNDLPGAHRGYGFIDYTDPAHAKLAIDTMNGFQVVDKQLKVNHAATVRPPAITTPTTVNNNVKATPMVKALPLNSFPPSASGANCTPLGSQNQQFISGRQNMSTISPSIPSMQINSLPSTLLPSQIPYPLSIPPVSPSTLNHTNSIPSQQISSSYIPHSNIPQNISSNFIISPKPGFKKIKLSNMVHPSEVDEDLKLEIRTECLNYGQVLDVNVQIINNNAEVFVSFLTESDAARALPALNGRWFAGKQILCQLVS